MKGKARRFWKVVAIVFAAALAAVVLMPLWLPWVLKPVAGHFGADYSRYERLGYGTFALRDVRYENQRLHFKAQRVETALPTVILARHLAGRGSDLIVSGWSLTFLKGAPETEKKPVSTPAETVSRLQVNLAVITNWMARAALTNGSIILDRTTSSIPWLTWSGPAMAARAVVDAPKLGKVPVNFELRAGATGTIAAAIDVPKFRWKTDALLLTDSNALTLLATNTWGTNRITATAEFHETFLPVQASLSAPALHITHSNITAAGYEAVEAEVEAITEAKSYRLRADLHGISAQTNRPALFGSMHLSGDTNSLTIEQMGLEGAGTHVALAKPLRIDYTGKLLSEPTSLVITSDLAQLPLPGWRGKAEGRVDVAPWESGFPAIRAHVAAKDLNAEGFRIASLNVRGGLRWPLATVDTLMATLDSGAKVQASLSADITNRFLSNATVRVAGSLPTNLMPSSVLYSNFTLAGVATGPFTNLAHEVNVTVEGLTFAKLLPLRAELHEKGRRFRITEISLTASNTTARAELRGSGERTKTNTLARIDALSFQAANNSAAARSNPAPAFHLAAPANVTLLQAKGAGTRVILDQFTWSGANGGELSITGDVRWPVAGQVKLALRGLRTAEFASVLAKPLPVDAHLKDLSANVHWSNGPVLVGLNAACEATHTAAPPVAISLSLTNSETAVHGARLIAKVAAGDGTPGEAPRPGARARFAEVLNGTGIVPVSLNGTTNGFRLTIHSNAPLRLELHTVTNAPLAELLAQYAKVHVDGPSLQVHASGTLRAPEGTIDVSAATVRLKSLTNQPLPELKDLRLHVNITPAALELRELRATVAGQPMVVQGSVPLGREKGNGWRLHMDQATGDITIPSAELAAFAPFARQYLAPRGTLNAQMTLRPGMRLAGAIAISNAATAALPSIGPVYDINALVRLHDTTVEIESIRAHAAGAPLLISGRADFGSWHPQSNRLPVVSMRVTGTNVALVREAQKIMRADLDVRVTNSTRTAPVVAGTVNLHDSLFFAAVTDLAPGGVTKPSQRPPYFSIDAPLVRDWTLAVQVHGDKFLTVRAPLFGGKVSADLNVGGTLGEPRAVGEVRINSGTINFPFATMTIKQGFVTLGSANPYEPSLFITAAGRAFDYDLRFEVTGTASKPLTEFTSVPPLTSEQILLMVTSGQVPRSGYELSTGQRAQRVGIFVGKGVLSGLGLGGGDKLTIRSGESISESGRETYSVEYKVAEDVSLVGEYDRFDQYNAGVKWRIFSK